MDKFDFELEPKRGVASRFREQAFFIFGIVGVFWLIEIVDVIFKQKIERLGAIYPRDLTGLIGIPLAPFLHGNWGHLIGNTVPFVVLGGLVIISSDRKKFVGVSCIIALVAGLGTWTLAKGGYHIGASSLVFGYLGFLLWRAWLGRSLAWTLVAVLAGVLYGGIILTLLRAPSGISWSGHFFGLAGGVVAAYAYTPPNSVTPATAT